MAGFLFRDAVDEIKSSSGKFKNELRESKPVIWDKMYGEFLLEYMKG